MFVSRAHVRAVVLKGGVARERAVDLGAPYTPGTGVKQTDETAPHEPFVAMHTHADKHWPKSGPVRFLKRPPLLVLARGRSSGLTRRIECQPVEPTEPVKMRLIQPDPVRLHESLDVPVGAKVLLAAHVHGGEIEPAVSNSQVANVDDRGEPSSMHQHVRKAVVAVDQRWFGGRWQGCQELAEKLVSWDHLASGIDGSTHWSTRTMAKRFGISKDSVARIWRDHELRPWKVEAFKISNDPHIEEKLVDVVGLYLPPERAIVFSFDERTQCQALDRTQPSLPLKCSRAGTMTHDYKRNGTTDLFAASTSPPVRSSTTPRRSTPRPTCSTSSS